MRLKQNRLRLAFGSLWLKRKLAPTTSIGMIGERLATYSLGLQKLFPVDTNFKLRFFLFARQG